MSGVQGKFQTPIGVAADIDREERPWVIMAGDVDNPNIWDMESCLPTGAHLLACAAALTAAAGQVILNKNAGSPVSPFIAQFSTADQELITGMTSLFVSVTAGRNDEFTKHIAASMLTVAMAFLEKGSMDMDQLKSFVASKRAELEAGVKK